MEFPSVLWPRQILKMPNETFQKSPDFLVDLRLERIIKAIIGSKREYNLDPFYYTPLRDVETIYYRQEVMKDLENDELLSHIQNFAEKMLVVHRYMKMIEELDYEYNKKGWFLEAVLMYCKTVNDLAFDLNGCELKSRGMLNFRDYVNAYIHSEEFQEMIHKATKIKEALSKIKYCVIIGHGGKVSVKRYSGESDYSIDLEKTFSKFEYGERCEDYIFEMRERYGMSHVEAKILEFVIRLYPEPFNMLKRFCETYTYDNFMDEAILTFEREIQFYVAYLEFISSFKRSGLPFCYPEVADDKFLNVHDGFDMALAYSSLGRKKIVLNDFFLKDSERIIVVTGPNQGGKTTFARMFGQIHYFASLGLPVSARKARVFLFDRIFTHFEREEDIQNLRSKLEDDLIRIHGILNAASSKSIIILNEIFSSTTLHDGIVLSKKIMERILELDCLCVWVTFIDELSKMGDKVVSMVGTVDHRDPTVRTFRIVRKPANGLAYAISLAEKYDLTYEKIKERVKK